MLCTAYFRISSIWWRAQNETSPANWTKTGQSHARQAGKHHKTPWAWNFELVKLWKQALKQESKIVWICEQCEHHANPVSCACPSRSSSHWRVPLPSASSTSKRPSQSGTCPQSTETNRSETYGEELGWTWMNFAYRVWLIVWLIVTIVYCATIWSPLAL